MLAQPNTSMTVDEFLVWAEGRPGRHELVEGRVVAIAPERARHLETKFAVQTALARALRHASVPCRMLPDGITVRIDARTAYEPDALVYCGPRLHGDAVEAPDPVIVVEVLSPGTAAKDKGRKLAGYFGVPSVRHYLIVDVVRRLVTHHWRAGSGIETGVISDGRLRLDPPGIELALDELFPDA